MIVWQFERSLFFWPNEENNRIYYFIVNSVNIFVWFVVVLVWAAVKNVTVLHSKLETRWSLKVTQIVLSVYLRQQLTKSVSIAETGQLVPKETIVG